MTLEEYFRSQPPVPEELVKASFTQGIARGAANMFKRWSGKAGNWAAGQTGTAQKIGNWGKGALHQAHLLGRWASQSPGRAAAIGTGTALAGYGGARALGIGGEQQPERQINVYRR